MPPARSSALSVVALRGDTVDGDPFKVRTTRDSPWWPLTVLVSNVTRATVLTRASQEPQFSEPCEQCGRAPARRCWDLAGFEPMCGDSRYPCSACPWLAPNRLSPALSFTGCGTRPSRPSQLVKQPHAQAGVSMNVPATTVCCLQMCLGYLASVVDAAEQLMTPLRKRVFPHCWVHCTPSERGKAAGPKSRPLSSGRPVGQHRAADPITCWQVDADSPSLFCLFRVVSQWAVGIGATVGGVFWFRFLVGHGGSVRSSPFEGGHQ